MRSLFTARAIAASSADSRTSRGTDIRFSILQPSQQRPASTIAGAFGITTNLHRSSMASTDEVLNRHE